MAPSIVARCDDTYDPTNAVMERLQGEWIVTGMEDNEFKASLEDVKGMKWSIAGNVISATNPDGSVGQMGFKLDPTKSPQHFDIIALKGDLKVRTDPGIFELKGRRLRVVYRDPDNKQGKRPQAFPEKEPLKQGYGMITLERKPQ